MLLFSSMKLFAFAAIAGLAIAGVVFFYISRRGWMRNGYFTIPSVILIVIGLFIAFQAIGSGAVVAAVGLNIDDHPLIALTLNGLSEILVMLLGSVLISLAARQHPFAVFRLEGTSETPVMAYILAIPIILSAQIAGGAISAMWVRALKFFPDIYSILDKFETAGDKSQESMVTAHGLGEFAVIFLFVAIVPAFAEETLFRGFAQSNIERSGHRHARPFGALLVTSLLFATVHISVFKFPGLLMLGLALGWMAYRTNNLFVGALAHAANNGFIVIALYLIPDQIMSKANQSLVSTEELPAMQALVILLIVIPFLAAFLFLFQRITSNIYARDNAEHDVQAHIAEGMQRSSDMWRSNDHPSNDLHE
jgi:membrane protease YdiL (CAAX protease family)